MLRSLFSLARLPCSSFSSRTRNKFICKMSTKPALICPKFVSVERGDIYSRSKLDGDIAGIRFRLVSFNILAQAYVKSSFFPHSPSPCLKWKARSQAILTVLRNLGADFLCLQELDKYDSCYKKNMESCGYSSIYIQRSGKKRDCCGVFYKESCSSSAEVECFDERPTPLCSVYGSTGGEPAFTNCTPDFTNTLDYVLFSPSDQIKPVSLLELPEADSTSVCGGLPNYYHPSDHLPIGAEFEITTE